MPVWGLVAYAFACGLMGAIVCIMIQSINRTYNKAKRGNIKVPNRLLKDEKEKENGISD